jgi:hypothetical protein
VRRVSQAERPAHHVHRVQQGRECVCVFVLLFLLPLFQSHCCQACCSLVLLSSRGEQQHRLICSLCIAELRARPPTRCCCCCCVWFFSSLSSQPPRSGCSGGRGGACRGRSREQEPERAGRAAPLAQGRLARSLAVQSGGRGAGAVFGRWEHVFSLLSVSLSGCSTDGLFYEAVIKSISPSRSYRVVFAQYGNEQEATGAAETRGVVWCGGLTV